MERKYQRNFQPCPKCGRAKGTRSKTCAYCARRGRASVSRRNFVECICEYCHAPFEIPLWRVKQKRGRFCSRECANHFLTTLTGQNSIRWRGGTAGHRRGIGWQVARQWAIVRANSQCEDCGAVNSALDVHHIKPYRQCKDAVEANSPRNLVVLCDSCHGKREALGKITNQGMKRG